MRSDIKWLPIYFRRPVVFQLRLLPVYRPFPNKSWLTRRFNDVKREQRWACAACGFGDNLTVHHIRHRARGGTHARKNLLVLCGACHRYTHEHAERDLSLMAKLILVILLFGPRESQRLAGVIRFLHNLRRHPTGEFHPALLVCPTETKSAPQQGEIAS